MGSGAEFFFWGSLVLLAYVYFGYPLVAALRARFRPRPRLRAPIEPFVSIVVVAHNEADRIAARIENLLALDYPVDRFEIVVASDGSTDDTVECARRYEFLGVRVRPFATRRGKSAVLNAVVPHLRSDIVLFADARQRFDRGTLRALVENFADPTVGAVSGELVLTTAAGTAAAGQGTAFYWRYEKFIRSAEGRADSTVGATGAIYAIRRELFEPIPDDTILDDVLIPLRIVRKGFRVLFEPGARAYDCASATARQEFVRKARTIAGTFQLFARERWLFNPLQQPALVPDDLAQGASPGAAWAPRGAAAGDARAGLAVALSVGAGGSAACSTPRRCVGYTQRAERGAVRSSSVSPAPSAFSAGRRWSASSASSRTASRSPGNASPASGVSSKAA